MRIDLDETQQNYYFILSFSSSSLIVNVVQSVFVCIEEVILKENRTTADRDAI